MYTNTLMENITISMCITVDKYDNTNASAMIFVAIMENRFRFKTQLHLKRNAFGSCLLVPEYYGNGFSECSVPFGTVFLYMCIDCNVGYETVKRTAHYDIT